MKERKCTKCEEEKTVDLFPKDKKRKDGLSSWCKKCFAKNTNKFRSKNPDKYKATTAKWARENRDKSNEYRRNNPDLYRAIELRHRNKYPHKDAARRKAAKGVEVLIKGNHRHHWSYSQDNWLDIIELNPKDHKGIHKLIHYNDDLKIYLTKEADEPLDTKEKHILFCKSHSITVYNHE